MKNFSSAIIFRQCPNIGARLCRRPAAAAWTLLRLTLRAQPRSEEWQIRSLSNFLVSSFFILHSSFAKDV
jgi:hypothetical protein